MSRSIQDLEKSSSELENDVTLDVKENEELSCCCNGGKCDGSQTNRLVDENNLRELLFVLSNQQGDINEEWGQIYSFPRLLLANNTNENHLDPFVLQPSLFHKNHVPPTIYFNTKLTDDSRPPVGLPKRLHCYFKWKISSITPNSMRNCIAFMKFETIKTSNTTDQIYLGSWCKHMLTTEFKQLEEWRKVNHYPGSFHLGRKDKLCFRLRIAKLKYGQDKFGDFHPVTFVMPRDYGELREYWRHSPSKLFIIKPPASARGNGIKVINDISQLPPNALETNMQADSPPSKKSTIIVQQYIANPCLLENGKKFDLRVYVLLTSTDPLRIYVYDEGLVRFASTKYTSQEDGIIDQYMHLTNYFVNKNNQEYQINNDCDSLHGCKWTLKRFWRYLEEHHSHVDTQLLQERIIDIIIKTIICCEGPITRLSHQNCKNDYTSFELFGFDIILDENFKPWILEVNITPSLKSESDLDTSVKYKVIKDMFNLVGYNLPPVPLEDLSHLGNLADCKLFFDSRLYRENLTRRDKVKHTKYQKLFRSDHVSEKYTTNASDKDSSDLSQENMVTASGTSQTPKVEEPELNGYVNDEHMQAHVTPTNGTQSDASSRCAKSTSDSILNDLTQNDLRILMLSEDELSRKGQFMRVFPSPTSSKYLKYFDKMRYYNILLDAWERRYHDNRLNGIERLSKLATFLN